MKRHELQILGTLALLLALGCADEGEEPASAEMEALAGPEAIGENAGDGEPLPGDSVRHPSQGKRNRRKKPTGSMQEGNPPWMELEGREESPRREETPDGRSPEADVPGEGEEDSSVEEADVEGVDASADSLAEESDSAESDAGGEDADSESLPMDWKAMGEAREIRKSPRQNPGPT